LSAGSRETQDPGGGDSDREKKEKKFDDELKGTAEGATIREGDLYQHYIDCTLESCCD